MPILYACVVTRENRVILQGHEKYISPSQCLQRVVENYKLFERYGRKSLEFEEYTFLHYKDEGPYAFAVISKGADVNLQEATIFMDKMQDTLFDQETGCMNNPKLIYGPNADQNFIEQSKALSQFIQQWNGDPDNRAKTYLVYQDLVRVKEVMIDNLEKVIQRDGKLEDLLVKGENIENKAQTYKEKSKQANKKMCRRKCCCWFTIIATILVVGVGVFLILWLWLGVLTCDKLSHCLFDFDCVDLNVYEKEQYNYDYFEIKDLISTGESQVHHVGSRDYIFKSFQMPKKDKKGYIEQEEFMRLMFKPDTQTLWGFHHSLIPLHSIASYKEDFQSIIDNDEENDVDMNNTMWMVLRKTKPLNETLKRFFADSSNHPIKLKDIVKFGRVNFKVSALSSSKLDNFIQGRYEDVTKNAYQQSNITQQNLITQMNDLPRAQSHLSLQHTEMNLYDNVSMTMIQNVSVSKTPVPGKRDDDEASSQGGPRVCRICLGEYEESDPDNELITPCKCSGSMQYIHIDCLREWMNGKKLVYNGNFVRSFFWKALECELCKTPFENQMKGKLFQIMDFEKPEDDYLIMESVKSAPAKVIHVFFLDKSNEFKIGRSVDTDMKIADISVSRVHSLIKIKNGQLYIEDNGAKFGTLVKIRDPMEILQGGNPDRSTNLFQIGRSLIYFGLSNLSKSSKRNKKSMRKIECIQNISYCQAGYLVTKNMKAIPQQFVFKDQFPPILRENPIQQQFSVTNQLASNPRTQRENESEITSPKRPPKQTTENEDNKQNQMITDDLENQRFALRRQSIGEGPPQDKIDSQLPLVESFSNNFNNQNANDADLQSSVNKGFNDSQIRRNLSPRGMNRVNQQNSERRTYVRNSTNLPQPGKKRHIRKISQKDPKQIEELQLADEGSYPYSMQRFYSNSHSKVVKMGIENIPAMAQLSQNRYNQKHQRFNKNDNADITSNYGNQDSSQEDQEAVIEKASPGVIREMIINSSSEEEQKQQSPRQVIGRTKNQQKQSKNHYNDYISGEDIKNAFKNQPAAMTRNHTRPEFLDESGNSGGGNITTQMTYQNIDPQRTRSSRVGDAAQNRRQKENPTASGVRQIEEEDDEIEDILSNQESIRQHRTSIDGRIIKGKNNLQHRDPPTID